MRKFMSEFLEGLCFTIGMLLYALALLTVIFGTAWLLRSSNPVLHVLGVIVFIILLILFFTFEKMDDPTDYGV